MHYKTLKKDSDITKFRNYLETQDFILIFDLDSNHVDTFKNLLKEHEINFLNLNSLQVSCTKPHKEFHNILSGNTILVSLSKTEVGQRSSIVSNLQDASKLYAFLKGVIFEKKVFRSTELERFLRLNSSISTSFVQHLLLNLKKVNSTLTKVKKN